VAQQAVRLQQIQALWTLLAWEISNMKLIYNTSDFTPYDSSAPEVDLFYVTQEDGALSVVQIVKTTFVKNEQVPGKFRIDWYRELTDEEVEEELQNHHGPVTKWRRGHEHECTDYDYMDCMSDDGKQIVVDMDKARHKHMNHVRAHRNVKLEELDKKYLMEVTKVKGDVSAIAAKKQRLRDIPQTFDTSKIETLWELKQTWPDDLADK
jgi:hypothetical protein